LKLVRSQQSYINEVEWIYTFYYPDVRGKIERTPKKILLVKDVNYTGRDQGWPSENVESCGNWDDKRWKIS